MDAAVINALKAYSAGYFPMADARGSGEFEWYAASLRSLLPIETLHISRSLRKLLRKDPFEIRIDSDLAGVLDGCAAPRQGEKETWINAGVRALVLALHNAGYAHSVECWRGDLLVGGVYGVAIGSVFCAESMFSQESCASTVALVHLCARLSAAGFKILDTQYINSHVAQFGAFEISRQEYETILFTLARQPADFLLSAHPGITASYLLKSYMLKRGKGRWTEA